jgi:hypothetical protein
MMEWGHLSLAMPTCQFLITVTKQTPSTPPRFICLNPWDANNAYFMEIRPLILILSSFFIQPEFKKSEG